MSKSYKSGNEDGNKCPYAELPARLAVDKKSWKLGYRLPKLKRKTKVRSFRSECNTKVHACFSYLQGDISRYVPFWESSLLNRKRSAPLSHLVELIHNPPLDGLCYGCDRKLQKHFHHEKPVRTGGGYTYFSKKDAAKATGLSLTPEGTSYIPEDDMASLALSIKQLLSLAAETDLLQHMKRLASCTMVHKTQDKLSVELLKEFLEYACGLKLQQECFIKSPSISRLVEDAPWRSITNFYEPLNAQHIQPAENSAVLLMLLRSCQLKGQDPNVVLMFLKKSLLNKCPDAEEVILDTSTKEQPIDNGWFICRRVFLPKLFQTYLENKGGFGHSHFTDIKNPKKQDTQQKKKKCIPVFNSIMMLPKLLREEEEKILLQSLQNISKEERIVFLKQHGLLQDKLHTPFIPGLSERPRGLWTEPKAFKVHHKKVFTRPTSPFSNDRLYNIGSLKANFQVQKSEKELTQFMKIHFPQIPSANSPVYETRNKEYSMRQQEPSNTQPIFLLHHDNFDESCQESSVRISSSLTKEMKSRTDIEIAASKQENLPEVNQMEEKMSHMQELYSASQSNFKPEFEDNHQVDNDPDQEASLLSIASFQSTTSCEDEILQGLFPSNKVSFLPTFKEVQRDEENKLKKGEEKQKKKKVKMSVQQPNITKCYSEHFHDSYCGLDTTQRENCPGSTDKCLSLDTIQNDMLHPRELDSLVYLETSAQRTKSPPIQLVTHKPDTLEQCKDESQLKTEKPPDAGDDRQANEKAEAIITKKEEGKNLPRAVFTKRKPLPNIKRYPRKHSQKARIVGEETQRLRPSILDFLTKYCIIKPERLSLYERVFLKYCSHENRDQESTESSSTNFNYMPGGFDHVEEVFALQKAKENIDIGRKIQIIVERGSVSDQLEKIQFQIKKLLERKKHIMDTVQELQDRIIQFQATINDQQFHTTEQKRQKKRKMMKGTKFILDMKEKKDNFCGRPSSVLSISSGAPMKQAEAHQQIEHLDLKIKFFWSKSKEINSRLSELNQARTVLEHKNKEVNLEAIIQNSKVPPEERRLQSALYRRLHPDKDLALDLADLEEALQDVNKSLVSPKEFSYIFHILELPGQYRLNLELFCVIAALSEKITQLDPVLKKLINKLDFEALSVRIEKAKELWHLLQEDKGEKERRTKRRSQRSALKKFNRTDEDVLSFLDFVTYIPLFVEIHEGIVENPLSLTPNAIPVLEYSLGIDSN
ncbi:uncharacterized protein LOC129326929 isoform X3 [Eublepharis macularius]|uniref:Uncharacterized protein LOC129326929 isoform X3 n=1 Tax=Eublepharis macularius TaxID=481883 RepID=A0AA97J5A4_EUBMA|nr:uncharacterized protein LOC129326929 isoform X3 [Eublepharis macularius]